MKSNKGSPDFPLRLNLKSDKHLSLMLKLPIEEIKYFTIHKNNNYRELILRQNKNGKIKERVLYNPFPKYKKVLRAINSRLLRISNLPEGVLGGVIGKCIADMAKVHWHQEAILLMDLRNFFPSIKSGRVFKLFTDAGCSSDIAGTLTDIVTLNGSIPQGFPTSPMLANLIAFDLDVQHIAQSMKYNLNRTRWIDDIVFSGRSKDLSKASKPLLGAVTAHGFKLNNAKTEYQIRSDKPVITGLSISSKLPHVPIYIIDKVHDILNDCVCSGIESVQAAYECDAFGHKKDLQSSLKGRILYISRYNPADGKELMDIFQSIN